MTESQHDVRSSPLHPLCAIHFSLQYLKESSSQTFFQSALLKFLDPSKQFVIPFNTVCTPESPVKGFKKKKKRQMPVSQSEPGVRGVGGERWDLGMGIFTKSRR